MYNDNELEFLDNFNYADLLNTLKSVLSDNKNIGKIEISNNTGNVHITLADIIDYKKEQLDLYDTV